MLVSRFLRFHGNTGNPAALAAAAAWGRKPLPGVGRVIVATSCKGGVGKSTVAMNTALSLSKLGAKVGILDADVYGPSVPTMSSSLDKFLTAESEDSFYPIDYHGIETVSLGHAVEHNTAILWKGPMVSQIVGDMLRKAMWSKLDYLIIDTPPGTGDVPMAIQSTVPVDGAIIVTSPQRISVEDVARSVEMYQKWKVPIVGIVQNFDGFVCDGCKTRTNIFPGNGAADMAKKYGIDVIGSIPIDPAIAAASDTGEPIILSNPDSDYAKTFSKIAALVMEKIPKREPRIPAKKRKNQ